MKRMCIALFLSVCLHIAVLSLIPQDAGEAPVREILRVSLLAAGPQRGGGASGGGGAPAPAVDAGQRREEGVQSTPQPKPPVPRPPRQTQPPVPQPPRQTQPPAANTRPPDQQQPRETQPTPREETASLPVSNLSGEENTGSESGETSEGNASGAGVGSGAGSGSGSSPETGSGGGSAGGTGSSTGIVDAESLKVLRKKTPDYPMISRRRKDQGTVVLLIQIEGGLVKGVEIERSSGHTALDESAARAVREWKFDVTGYGDLLTARISFAFSLK